MLPIHIPAVLLQAANPDEHSNTGWATPSIVDLFSLIVAFGIGVIAGGYTLWERRRRNKEAIADLHRELTTGEVANARDVIGTYFYAPTPRKNAIDDGQLTKAYYQLCWAIERVSNIIRARGFHLHFPDTKTSRAARALRCVRAKWSGDVSAGLGWSLDEILRNIARLHTQEHDRLHLDDDDVQAWLSRRLVKPLRKRYVSLKTELQHQSPTTSDASTQQESPY